MSEAHLNPKPQFLHTRDNQHRNSTFIQNAFKDVPEDVFSLTMIPEKNFEDNDFDQMPCYKIKNVELNDLTRRANDFKINLTRSLPSANAPYIVLLLATHLQSQKIGWHSAILKGYWPASITKFPELNEPEGEAGEDVEQANGIIDKLVDLKFSCFCAAYMLRLITKSEGSLKGSWDHMKSQFSNFYSHTAPVGWPVPTIMWLKQIKSLIMSDCLIMGTWLKTVVKCENVMEASRPAAGMIRYLGVMPFSFAGMHAYTLFCDVKIMTNQKDSWLLDVMRCPENNSGLKAIADILANYAPRQGVERSTKYKYARLVGPQFFPKLQTKKCTALVFLLISILKLKKRFEENQDPENIVGIDSLAPNLKAMLKNAAKLIVKAASEDNN